MGFLDKLLKIFVGDKSRKDIGIIQPLVDQIKTFEAAMEKLSHDELRAKSDYFREEIKKAQADIQKEIDNLQQLADEEQDIDKKEDI